MTARLLRSCKARYVLQIAFPDSLNSDRIQLDDANGIIGTKTETISELESEVETLKASLQVAQTEVETKTSALEALEQTKAQAEEELAAIRETLEKLQADQSGESSKLEAVHTEVR